LKPIRTKEQSNDLFATVMSKIGFAHGYWLCHQTGQYAHWPIQGVCPFQYKFSADYPRWYPVWSTVHLPNED
jgi:hypothetical protein